MHHAAASQLESLGWGLGLGLAGALGALPVARLDAEGAGAADPLALLTWIAFIALPFGFLYGASGALLLRFGAVAPACWMAALALVDAPSESALPSPVWAALAWTGMFLAGAGLGRIGSRAVWSGGGALLLCTALLSGLPGRGGLAGSPWPPRAASTLLDLSPVVLLCETAGVRDIMWHRSLYAPAGIDRFQRSPWRGELAGPALFLVGCALALGGGLASKRRAR